MDISSGYDTGIFTSKDRCRSIYHDNPNGVFYLYARARNGTIFEYWPEGTGLFSWQPGPTTGVGVYGSGVQKSAELAITDAWNGLGSVSGICGTYTEDIQNGYACPTGADASMEEALSAKNTNDFWLSIWTIGQPFNGDTWHTDGYTAGYNAANEIMGLNGSYVPTYIILDYEGFYAPPTTTTHLDNWLNGWAEGIRANSLLVSPAYYASQSLIGTYNLFSLSQAAFPAITSGTIPNFFIKTESAGTPVWSSIYGNDSVSGYSGYYAYCQRGYPNSGPPYVASSATTDVESWGGAYSTVQFEDSGVDCMPSQASGSGG